MTSGIPQRSVLEFHLFTNSINNLGQNDISKFPDNVKVDLTLSMDKNVKELLSLKKKAG